MNEPQPIKEPNKWMVVYREYGILKVMTVCRLSIAYHINNTVHSENMELLKVLDGDNIEDLIKWHKLYNTII